MMKFHRVVIPRRPIKGWRGIQANQRCKATELFAALFLSLFLSTTALAATHDVYQFQSPVQQQQFDTLTHELRCLVCQNQNLADSHAGLANDLRDKVYAMVIDGQSNQQIKAYLVDRYGDFVLFKPPVKATTWLLWFGPAVLLLFGLMIVVYLARKRDVCASDALGKGHAPGRRESVHGDSSPSSMTPRPGATPYQEQASSQDIESPPQKPVIIEHNKEQQ